MNEDKLTQTLRLFGELEAERKILGVLDIEAKRNTDNLDIFEKMMRIAYGDITMAVAGHHLMFMRKDVPLPIEIPSADALIFDHSVAKKVWKDSYKDILRQLAEEPTETRDALLRKLL
jgi:hypothetical protein